MIQFPLSKTRTVLFLQIEKKKNQPTNALGNIKCSIDLNILSDKFDGNQCSENAVDENDSKTKSKDKCKPSFNPKNIQLDCSKKRRLIVKLTRLEQLDIHLKMRNDSPTLLEQNNEPSSKIAHKACICNSGDFKSICNCIKKSPTQLSPKKTTDTVLDDKGYESPNSASSGFCSSGVSEAKDNYISNIQPIIADNELDVNIEDGHFQNKTSESNKCALNTEKNILSSSNRKENSMKVCVEVHSSPSNIRSDFDFKQNSNNKVSSPIKNSKKAGLRSNKKNGSSVPNARDTSQDCTILNSEVVSPSKFSTSESKNTAKSPEVQEQNVAVKNIPNLQDKGSAHSAESCSEIMKTSFPMKSTNIKSKTTPTEIKFYASESDTNLEAPESISKVSTELKPVTTKVRKVVKEIKVNTNDRHNAVSSKHRKLNDHSEESDNLLPEVDSQKLKNVTSKIHLIPNSKKCEDISPKNPLDCGNVISTGNNRDTQVQNMNSPVSQTLSENFEILSSKDLSPSRSPIAKSKSPMKSVENEVILCIKDSVHSLVSESNSQVSENSKAILPSKSTTRKSRRVLQSKPLCKVQDILSTDNNPSIDKVNTALSSQNSKCKILQDDNDDKFQDANCSAEIFSIEKDIAVSNSQVNSVEEDESFHRNTDKDLAATNNLSMQETPSTIKDFVSLLENTNIHEFSETNGREEHLDGCQIPNSDNISTQKHLKKVKSDSSIKDKKANLLNKDTSSKCTKSDYVPIKDVKNKDSKVCKSKSSDKNNVIEKPPKIKNKVTSKKSLSKSKKCNSQVLRNNNSKNVDPSNMDSDLNNKGTSIEIVQKIKKPTPKIQEETEVVTSINQNKELEEELTAQTNSHSSSISTNSPNLSHKISNSETNSDCSDAISLMNEDYLDFEPDHIDDFRINSAFLSKPSNFMIPQGNVCNGILESSATLNLDKTANSDLHTSVNDMHCEHGEVVPFCNMVNDLINRYQTNPKQYVPSEDDSESDDDHSFKRSRYETRNNIVGKPLSNCFTVRNNESSSHNSEDGKKSVSKIESSYSSSDDQNTHLSKGFDASYSSSNLKASPICSCDDVVVRIKEYCNTKLFIKAVEVARTYIEISCSEVNRIFIKKLLSSLFSSFFHSNDDNFSDFKIFETVMKLMHDFNLYDKQISSYFIVKCCGHPNLNIYAIHMFHICHQKCIALSTEAINTYGSLLKSEEVSLPVLLDYLDFIRSVCNKKAPKDITHLSLKKCSEKKAKFSDIHRMCSYLHRARSKEVDDLILENFLELCFKKCMWPHVAEMFMMWGTKNRLTVCLYEALAKNAKIMGKYFSKFADAVHVQEESIHPEFKVMVGHIGSALMLNAFEKKLLQSALEILNTLHVYNENYFEDQLYYDSNPKAKNVTNFFPFFVVFSSIDICLDNNRPKHAFTIFQEFSWISSTEKLNDEEKESVAKQKFHRLLKLIPLLNNTDSLSEGWEALKILLSEIEKDSFQGILGNRTTELRSIYNKYLVSLLNSGKILSAHDLYQHSLGPKKDIFLLKPVVLRGLVVAFSEHGRPETAYSLFMFGIMKNVYSIKKPEPECFPWEITILSNWTAVEIKFAIKWFIGTLFPLLLDKPQDTNFEKWFSFKINFKVIHPNSTKNRPKIDCLFDTESDPKYYIKKTRDVLKTMDPSLEFSDETDESALCITSASLYSYWLNSCPGASLKFPSNGTASLLSGKRRLSFGIKANTEEESSVHLPMDEKTTEFQSPNKRPKTSAENYVYEMIDKIRASTSTSTRLYSPVSPEHCPSFKVPKSVNSSSRSGNDIPLFNSMATDSSVQKLSNLQMEANTSGSMMSVNAHEKFCNSPKKDALMNLNVHNESYNSPKKGTLMNANAIDESYKSPKKGGSLNNNTSGSFVHFDDNQTLNSSFQNSNLKLVNSPQNANSTPTSCFVESNDVKEKNAAKQTTNASDSRKITSQKVSITYKGITDTPCSSKSVQSVLPKKIKTLKKSSSLLSLSKQSISKQTKLPIKRLTTTPKSIKVKNFENLTVCVRNNSTARKVSNIFPRTSLTGQNNITVNTESLSKNEKNNVAEFCVKIHDGDTMMHLNSSKSNVQKQNQESKKTFMSSLKGSKTVFQKQSTDLVPKRTITHTEKLDKISNTVLSSGLGIEKMQHQIVKSSQPKSFRPVINRNAHNVNKDLDFISAGNKLKTVSESSIASSSDASYAQLMFDEKGQRSEQVKVEFKNSAKPKELFSGCTCNEEGFKEIFQFLKIKHSIKHKNLSQEQNQEAAMGLAKWFVMSYKVTILDKRIKKKLSDFADCYIE